MAANRIKGITVEIGGDTTKLQTALRGVNTEIRTTQSQLRDVNNLLKLDPGNTELLAQKHRVTSLVRVFPTPEILSPKFFKSSPVAAIFWIATADWLACSSRLFNFCSVSMISLCRPSYCSCVISPFARASFACSAAAFRVSSFSFVSRTASPRSRCFCASSSVLPGSSFKRLLTSRSCDRCGEYPYQRRDNAYLGAWHGGSKDGGRL